MAIKIPMILVKSHMLSMLEVMHEHKDIITLLTKTVTKCIQKSMLPEIFSNVLFLIEFCMFCAIFLAMVDTSYMLQCTSALMHIVV